MVTGSMSLIDTFIYVINGLFPTYMVPIGLALGLGILGSIARAFRMLFYSYDHTDQETSETELAIWEPEPTPAPEPQPAPKKKTHRPHCPYCNTPYGIKTLWTRTTCPQCGGPLYTRGDE